MLTTYKVRTPVQLTINKKVSNILRVSNNPKFRHKGVKYRCSMSRNQTRVAFCRVKVKNFLRICLSRLSNSSVWSLHFIQFLQSWHVKLFRPFFCPNSVMSSSKGYIYSILSKIWNLHYEDEMNVNTSSDSRMLSSGNRKDIIRLRTLVASRSISAPLSFSMMKSILSWSISSVELERRRV